MYMLLQEKKLHLGLLILLLEVRQVIIVKKTGDIAYHYFYRRRIFHWGLYLV